MRRNNIMFGMFQLKPKNLVIKLISLGFTIGISVSSYAVSSFPWGMWGTLVSGNCHIDRPFFMKTVTCDDGTVFQFNSKCVIEKNKYNKGQVTEDCSSNQQQWDPVNDAFFNCSYDGVSAWEFNGFTGVCNKPMN